MSELFPIIVIGIAGFVYVLYRAARELPALLAELRDPWVEPPTREAGEDDQDIDFEAALRPIGRVPR